MSADPAPAPSSSFLTWSRAHRAFCANPAFSTWDNAVVAYRAYLRTLGPDAECWLAPYRASLSTERSPNT